MSNTRFAAVLIALFSVLAVPSSASALYFAPPEAGGAITDDPAVRGNAMVSADFNGDGRDDIAVGYQTDSGVQIRLAAADGGWTAGPTADAPFGASAMATGDLDKDGKADLVIYRNNPGGGNPRLVMKPGNGDGTFGASIAITGSFTTTAGWNALSVGDVDTDGNPDVIMGMVYGEYGIAYGDGEGGFTQIQRLDVPDAPSGQEDWFVATAVGDFNGDHENDLVLAMRSHEAVGNSGVSALWLLMGNGTRSLTPSSHNPLPIASPAGFIVSMKAADLDSDGDADVAASISDDNFYPPSKPNGSIRTWLGEPGEDLVALPFPIVTVDDDQTRMGPLQIADFDHDAYNDIAWIERDAPGGPQGYRARIARSLGGGSFATTGNSWRFDGAVAGGPHNFTVGDFNGDGSPDLEMGVGDPTGTGGLFFLQNDVDLSASPDEIDFGDVLRGSSTADRELLISNSGGPETRIDTVTLTGADASKFDLPADCTAHTIDAGEGCLQHIRFDPSVPPGSYAAQVHVTFGLTRTLDIPASVRVVAPAARFDPQNLDFGDLRLGQSSTETVTVTSSGDAPLTFAAGAYVDGSGAGRYSIESDTCSGETIDPGEECSITVKASANVVGGFPATLHLANDGYQSPSSIDMSMTGVDPGLEIDPSGWDFGGLAEGDSATRDFTITSSGTTAARITDVTVTSTDPGDFSLSEGGCIGTLDPAEQCQIQVAYSPQAGAGSDRSGQIQIETDAVDDPVLIPLTGTALKAEASITPNQIDFGAVPLGSSVSQTVTVDSTGDAPLHIQQARVDDSGGGSQEFSIDNDTCSASTVSDSCSYRLTFTPASRGDKQASSGIQGSNIEEYIPVTGKGIQPEGRFDRQSVGFQDAVIGSSSNRPTETFELRSTGPDPLAVSAVEIAGTDADSFRVSSNGCPSSLASGRSCPVEVTFDPRTGSPGGRSAILRATTDAGVLESAMSGLAVEPPAPTYTAKLKVRKPKKARLGGKARFKVTVINSGTAALSGVVLRYRAKQRRSVKAKGRVGLGTIATGQKLTRKIKFNLKRRKLRHGKRLRVRFILVKDGKVLTARTVRIRLHRARAKARKRR